MSAYFLHLFICCSLWSFSIGLTIQFEELVKSYDSTERPKIRDPVSVNVTLLINTLEVDDVKQVIRINGELQQEWEDYRLRYSTSTNHDDSIGLEGRRGERIKHHLWLPDLTIADGFHYTNSAPRDFLKIENGGHLVWTQQVFYEFPCEFDYSVYPIGMQECMIKLQSIGYSYSELEPRWADDEAVLYQNTLMSPRYYIENVDTTAVTVVSIHTAKRQLQVTLYLESDSSYSVKHTFLPFVATVVTAYLACFINVTGITARIVLCCASFVMAAIFHESTYNSAPQSSYTMAVEVFTGTCLTFIWVAIAESVLVDAILHLQARPGHASFNEGADIRGYTAALWLDRCFRILYPVIFLGFNAVFWIIYNMEDDEKRF